jgi:lysine-N-methylase
MTVDIDPDTLARFKASSHPLFATINDHITEFAVDESMVVHAVFNPVDGACPYLDPQRLCSIHAAVGEDALAKTCAVYPRLMTRVDGYEYRSLYMSCPEAVRLALMDRAPMTFERVDTAPHPRVTEFATIDTESADTDGKPYVHFEPINQFVIATLQDRRYAVWERVVIVGLFCERLQALVDSGDSASHSLALIDTFASDIESGALRSVLASVSAQPSLQVVFAVRSIEERLAMEYTSPRFIECYRRFLEGIGFGESSATPDLVRAYEGATAAYSDKLFADYGHVLEHVLVNYAFRSLFPLGPQASLHLVPKTIFAEYVTLVMQYSILRTLLVGIMARLEGEPGDKMIVQTIQSFSKTIEQSPAYLAQVRAGLESAAMATMPVMAALAR